MYWSSDTDGITLYISWAETKDIDELTKTINRMIDFEKRLDIMTKSMLYSINKKEELNEKYGLRKEQKWKKD